MKTKQQRDAQKERNKKPFVKKVRQRHSKFGGWSGYFNPNVGK